ncbi:MAG: cyclomaltodextrinase N-terminal domain-containing protein, partial [Elusimicrobia bacterium]|nr:cyclomaltodextrinase N-terminal domain-containing protein [Elusimicrobiota bacterium]
AAAPAAPQVVKVEPPSWWIGHTINPVRLLIRGRSLAGAKMRDVPGLRFGAPTSNAAGTYLFVDATIEPSSAPGLRKIRIVTPGGVATASFKIMAPLAMGASMESLTLDDVIYLIMVDRFANGDASNDDPAKSKGLRSRANPRFYHGGDFKGIMDHLAYLKTLGVTAVWLTPIYDNADRAYPPSKDVHQVYTDYHGYEPIDFYSVDEHFGSLRTLRQLVAAAHARGLKVIMDQVANHTGPRHPWVTDPPTPTWFTGTLAHHMSNAWQLWTLADPHATPQVQKATLGGWYANILPDLNQNDPEVARYLIQNSLWWVGMSGVDALRLDAVSYLPRSFIKRWMAALKAQFPGIKVIGEALDQDPAVVSYFQGGRKGFDGVDTGLDSVFDFPLMKAVDRAILERSGMTALPRSLMHDLLYPRPDWLVTMLGSHDEVRFMSRPGASARKLELAFSFQMTTRGIPLIYSGDEIAMTGGSDPDNRRDFPGGWPGDPHDAFSAKGRTAEQAGVFRHVQLLLRLRRELPALRHGRLLDLAFNDNLYAYARIAPDGEDVVVLNRSPGPQSVDLDVEGVLPETAALLPDRLGMALPARLQEGHLRAEIPALSASIFALPTKK